MPRTDEGVLTGIIPAIAPADMARIDRIMADDFGIGVLQLMEVAGLAVADAARARILGGDAAGKRVVVLAGPGGNGGDGLVAARFLHAWGADVRTILSHPPDRLGAAAAHQHAALLRLGLPVDPPPPTDAVHPPPKVTTADALDTPSATGAVALPPADLVIDALLGFGATGPPTGASAALVRAANAHPASVLAVDLPSGLDAATGVPHDPCVRAAATLTLALPKTGLLAPAARPYVGELVLADIGVPAAAYARLGLAAPALFARASAIPVPLPADPSASP